MVKKFRIAIDFDGTIVEHKFPDIGGEVPHAFEWIRKWQEAGALLILWTMRSDDQHYGDVLRHAVDFCRKRGIEFDGINEGPGDDDWTTSRKAYAHRYVDDAAVGCPLVTPSRGRPYVDWSAVGPAVLAEIEAYNGEWAPHKAAEDEESENPE